MELNAFRGRSLRALAKVRDKLRSLGARKAAGTVGHLQEHKITTQYAEVTSAPGTKFCSIMELAKTAHLVL